MNGNDYVLAETETTKPSLAGGKAATLAKMQAAGFAVPAFFVIPADINIDPETVANHFPPWANQANKFAVRSSSIEEDSPHSSFAGLLESFLEVHRGDLAERIKQVRLSASSERVVQYRRYRGLSGAPPDCAVIVQAMLKPSVSGVAFGCDPVDNNPDICVVTAIAGYGTHLVDGDEDGQMWRVDRNEAIVSRPDETGYEILLTDEQVREICRLTRKAGDFNGAVQDVEWAIENQQLWLLQSRPVTFRTALGGSIPSGEHAGVRRVWDNANISESYGGITTPLTFSFAQSAYEGVYRAFCRLMGVPQAKLNENDDMFSQMLGLFRGRVYYNLFSWYRLIALLPGYTSNRRFMEQMMGVREPMPEEVLVGISQIGWRGRMQDRFQFVRSVFHLISCYRNLELMAVRFDERIENTLSPSTCTTERSRLDELAAEYRRLERSLLNRWDAPLVNDFFTMICFGLLKSCSEKWSGPDGWAQVGRLLGGAEGMLSVEPARRIDAMGAMIATRVGAIDIFNSADSVRVEAYLETEPELKALTQSYLDQFGDRCMEELKLETPTLRDDPAILWRSIGRAATRFMAIGTSDTVSEPTSREDTERELYRAIGHHPIRRILMRRLVRKARRHLVLRENLRFQRTRVFGRVRRIVTLMGQRLVDERAIDVAEDVFYLEIGELLGFVEGGQTCSDLRSFAAVRRRAFEQYRSQPSPPERFETRGSVLLDERFYLADKPSDAPDTFGQQMNGVGCFPGLVRGIAVRITAPSKAQPEPGRILVAERTDPGWVMLFPGAAGVLVQRGSVLSHSATLAREMEIPTIVGIKGLMGQVRDGDVIEMDGGKGIAYVVEATPGGSAATRRRSDG